MRGIHAFASVVSLLLFLSSLPVFATEYSWDGGGGDSNWYVPENWDPDGVPVSVDTVTINLNGANVTVSASSPSISFASMTLGDVSGANTVSLTVSTTILNGGDLTISDNATLIFNTKEQSILNSLTIQSGGNLNHTANTTAKSYIVNLAVSTLTINSGGFINVDFKGYIGGYGDGAGVPVIYTDSWGQSCASGGGGRGGKGGAGTANRTSGGGGCYGSLIDPTDLGSGGGIWDGESSDVPGGSGGGAIYLVVSGTLTIDGSITARGQTGPAWCGGFSNNYGEVTGGGSGGSINITAGTIKGGGSISADGGLGGTKSCTTQNATGGAGGGGRIAVKYIADSGFNFGNISAYTGNRSRYAGAGTIYLKQGANDGDLIVDNNNISGAVTNQTVPAGDNDYTFDNVTIKNKGYYVIPANSTFTVNTLLTGGTPSGSITIGGKLNLPASQSSLSNITVVNNGVIVISPAAFTFNSVTFTHNGEIAGMSSLIVNSAVFDSNGTYNGVRQLTALTIGSGSTFEFQNINNSTPFTLTDLTIQTGGTLTHKANSTAPSYTLNLVINNNMSLESGGFINVNSKGYIGGYGDGAGLTVVYTLGWGRGTASGGGGRGGKGASGSGARTSGGGSTYGSLLAPVDLGSGGGIWDGESSDVPGGSGGGVINISVSGTLTIDGSMTARGQTGPAWCGGFNGKYDQSLGGGSGGSVNITAGILEGDGSISANGGNGGTISCPDENAVGGGGGGGRIHLCAETNNFSGTLNVNTGTGGSGSQTGTVVSVTTFKNHDKGQTSNVLTSTYVVRRGFFRFELETSTGGIYIDTVTFNLSNVTGIISGDFDSANLVLDEDKDGIISSTETNVVGGDGAITIWVDSGTIKFTENFSVAGLSSVDYILVSTITNLEGGDAMTVSLSSTNVIVLCPDLGGKHGIFSGSADSVNHLATIPPVSPVILDVFLSSVSLAYGLVNADAYMVDASTAPDFTGTIYSSSTMDVSLSTLIVGAAVALDPNTTYYLRAGALWGSVTYYADVSPVSTSTLASPIEDAQVYAAFATLVTVNWKPVGAGEAKEYVLEASTKSNFAPIYDSSSTTDINLSTLTITGLLRETTYYFRVGSVNWNNVHSYAFAGSTETVPNLEFEWDGGGGNSDWYNPVNWNPDELPTAVDTVTINLNGANVTVSAASPAINFASMTLGDVSGVNAVSLTMSTTILNCGDLAISNNATLTFKTLQQSILNSLTIQDGGNLNHTANTTARNYIINLAVSSFTIDVGGVINLNSRGHSSSEGLGPGSEATNNFGSYSRTGGGAGYAGKGGSGTSAGGICYGSLTDPVVLGSGGGHYFDINYEKYYYGGPGGGELQLNVSGTLTIDGSITSNGGTGGTGCGGYLNKYAQAAGGGSGGTINIIAGTIEGTGSISASGGNGGARGACASGGGVQAGGGGGGRVAIKYAANNGFNFDNISAYGKIGGYGGAGTIYLKEGANDGDLIVDNDNHSGQATNQTVPSGDNDYTFGTVTIDNKGYYVTPANSTFTVNTLLAGGSPSGSLTIGGKLYLPASQSSLSNITIVNNGVIVISPSAFTFDNVPLTHNGEITGISDLIVNSAVFYSNGTYGGILELTTLTIGSGATFDFQNLNNSTSFTLTDLTIQSGGTLTHKANGVAQSYMLNLVVNNDMSINTGGIINLNSRGNSSSEGLGPGSDTTNNWGSYSRTTGGGGHGGNGGSGSSAGGGTYDALLDPVNLGSGGGRLGNWQSSQWVYFSGGAGGGALKLNVSGILTVDGSITANGGTGTTLCGGYNGKYAQATGGGSGGAINIIAGTMEGTGSGLMSVNGGNGGARGICVEGGGVQAGGGGGGRIHVCAAVNNFLGTASYVKGTGGASQPGTVVSVTTLKNHSQGQTSSVLTSTDAVKRGFFRFELETSAGGVDVDTVTFNLSNITGIVLGDFDGTNLVLDEDKDGIISSTETNVVGGDGAVTIWVDSGTIKFTEDFSVAGLSSVDYILVSTITNIEGGDAMTVSLSSGGVIPLCPAHLSNQGIPVKGSADSVNHLTTIPPVSPVILDVFLSSVSLAYILVNADAYMVEACTEQDFSGTIYSSSTMDINLSTLTVGAAVALDPNTTYYLRAGALWGSVTYYADVWPVSTSTLANLVEDAMVYEIFWTSVTLNWSAFDTSPPAASSETSEGYQLEASSTNFGQAFPGGIVYSSVTSEVTLSTLTVGTVTPLELGTTYYFRVGSLNWNGAPHYIPAGSAITRGWSSVWNSSQFENTYSVAWGDFDNDGDIDIAAGNVGGANRVYRNNSDGTFSSVWDDGLIENTHGMAWGDFDNDGDLDITAANDGGTNKVYRNNGDGTFSSVWNSSQAENTYDVAWADFDNDGYLDIAAVNAGGANRMYRNNADGTFSSVWDDGTAENTFSVACGDFDGDGYMDIAIGNNGENNKIYRNNGDRTFTLAWNDGRTEMTKSLAWGDFDNDGLLDIAVGNFGSGSGQINRMYKNTGGGTFSSVWNSAETEKTQSLALGDFDNDGLLDIVVGNEYETNRVYQNNGGEAFAPVWNSAESKNTYAVAWGDFGGDGDLDIFAGNFGTNLIYKGFLAGANLKPSAPDGLAVSFEYEYGVEMSTLTFRWDPGDYDSNGSTASIYYAVAVATVPLSLSADSSRIVSPSSATGPSFIFTWDEGSPFLGHYMRPAYKMWPGDAGPKHGIFISSKAGTGRVLFNTTYYFRVQSIDAGLARSAWSAQDYVYVPSSPKIWDGGDGNWYTASNWDPDGVPGPADIVYIDDNVTVTVDASSPSIRFASLTLGNAGASNSASLIISTTILNGGKLIIHGKAGLVFGTTHQSILTGDVTMHPGSIMKHKDNYLVSKASCSINLSVGGSFDLKSGASISVSGLGYDGGVFSAGPDNGSGPGGGTGPGGGGGHGGAGGAGAAAGGGTNDSLTNPRYLGSGGGSGDSSGDDGGDGGGLIILDVNGTFTIDGLIEAGGFDGDDAGSPGCGGGAGGSINLTAGTLVGNGVLNANGGDGGDSGSSVGGGGGGGGRIVMSAASCSVSLSTAVWDGGPGGSGSGSGTAGASGTISPLMDNAPGNFKGTVTSFESINWSWNSAASATGYRVFSSSGVPVSPLLPSGTLNYLQSGLTPNTTYENYVAAYNCVHSSAAVSFSTRTLAAPPEFVSPPLSEADNRVFVEWGANGNSPETIYTFQRSTDSAFAGAVAETTMTATKNGDFWPSLTDAPGNVGQGGSLEYPGTGDYVYAFQGNGSNAFWQYSILNNTWEALESAPGGVDAGDSLLEYPGSGDYIYAFQGNTAAFWRYSISGDTWETMTSAPDTVGHCALEYPGRGDYIYAFRGNTTSSFWRYSMTNDTWETMTSAPGGVWFGGSLVYPDSGNHIYALKGNGGAFWRYSIKGDTWETQDPLPVSAKDGGSLVYPGSGDYIYAFQGDNTAAFWRYSISQNTWEAKNSAPNTVYSGGSLVYGGGDTVFALGGGGSSKFWKYKLADTLAPLTTYYFRAYAQNADGVLTSSTSLGSVWTNVNYPRPAEPVFDGINHEQISVHWSTASNPAGTEYYFEIASSSDFVLGLQDSNWKVDDDSHTFTGLDFNTVHYFRGKARQSGNPSNESYRLDFPAVRTHASPPAAVSVSSAPDNRVVVEWDANGNQAGTEYTFQRSTDSMFAGDITESTTTAVKNEDFWFEMSSAPANVYSGGSLVYPDSGDYVYAFGGNDSDAFWRYSMANNTWETRTSAPGAVRQGSSLGYPGSGDYLYAFRGNNTDDFWRYSISLNTWETLPSAPDIPSFGGSLAHPGSGDYIFAFRGGDTTDFWRYSMTNNNWKTMAPAPDTVYMGGSLVYPGSGDHIYAFRGNSVNAFWKYSISSDTWDSSPADAPSFAYYGGSLVYPGSGDYIYALKGNDTAVFWRYSLTNDTWETMSGAPDNVYYGGSLVYGGKDTVFAFKGNTTGEFWKYRLADTLDTLTTYYFQVSAKNSEEVSGEFIDMGSIRTNVAMPWPSTAPFRNITSDQISVHWEANGNPAGTEYYFEIAENSDFSPVLNNSGWNVDFDSHTFSGLSIGTQYFFRGRARESGNPSNESAITVFRSAFTRHNLPQAQPFTEVSSNSITANWGNNGNPPSTRYEAQMSTAAGFTGDIVSSETFSMSAVFDSLFGNLTYYFQVQAINPDIIPDEFTSLGSTITLAAPPVFVSALTAPADNRVMAGWGANGNSDGTVYTLQRSTDPGFLTAVMESTTTDLGNADVWSSLADTPAEIDSAKPCLAYPGGDYIYAFRGERYSTSFWKYSISQDTWDTSPADAPGGVWYGAALVSTETGSDFIYALRGNNETDFWRYSISLNTWETLYNAPDIILNGGSLTYPGSGDYIYAFAGGYTTHFWRYSISVNTWETLVSAPNDIGGGGSLTYPGSGDYIYACRGDQGSTDFWRYSISLNTWEILTDAPDGMDYGGSSVYPDSGEYIYVRRGGQTDKFLRYSISQNTWETLADSPDTVWRGAMGYGGNNYIYAFREGYDFWKYKLAEPLPPLTTYYFQVNALNAAGSPTGWTDIGSVRTNVNYPRPDEPAYTDIGGNQFTVRWTTGNPAGTQYYFEVAESSDFVAGWQESGWLTDASSNTFSGLEFGTLYYVRGKAREGGNPSNESYRLDFTPVATTCNPPAAELHTNISSVSVTANWDKNGNPVGTEYLAVRATDSGFTQNVDSTTWITITSATFSGLTPNTSYYFHVKARSPLGDESNWTDLPGQRTDAAVPGNPGFGGVTGIYVLFTWEVNSNPSGTEFWAEAATSSNPWVAAATAGWITADQAEFDNLLSETTYYFRVRARTTEAIPALSTMTAWTGVISTQTMKVPDPPSGLVVDLEGISMSTTHQLHISWSDNSDDEDGFTLAHSTDGANFNWSTDLIDGTSEYLALDLEASTSYYYKVRAYMNATGSSSWSNTDSLFTRAAAPGSPSFIQVSTATFEFGWTTGVNPPWVEYTAEISTMPGLVPLFDSSTTVNDSASFSGLTSNTTYYARVRARNGNGVDTDYAGPISTITLARPPTDAAFGQVWATSMTVVWNSNENPPVTRFVADISTSAGFSGEMFSSTTLLEQAVFDSLVPNTSYYFRVKAVNELDVVTSTAMPAGTALTLARVPGFPAESYDVYSSSVIVRWDTRENPSYTGYRVQRSAKDDSGFLIIGDDSSWQTGINSWAFSLGIDANSTYYFRIKAKNLAGLEAPPGLTEWFVLYSTQTLARTPIADSPDVFSSSITARWITNNNPGIPFLAELSSADDFTPVLASSTWKIDITSHAFTGLTPNTSYFIRVRARNSSGVDTPNILLYNEYTLAAMPGGPLAGYNRSGSDVIINWDKMSNPDHTEYFAVRSSTPDFSVDTDSTTWIEINFCLFTGLDAGTTYYFRVRARNKSVSPVETGWRILPSTMTLPAPIAPSGLFLSYPDATSVDRLWLNWNDNSTGEFGFRIYESTDGAFSVIKDTVAGVENYLSVTLSTNTLYYYKVAAYNFNGESYSNVASSHTRALKPGALDFSEVQTNSLKVNWTSNTNPPGTSYTAEISIDAGFLPVFDSSQGFATSAVFSGLSANLTYYAQVKATNGSGADTAYTDLGSTRTKALAMRVFAYENAPASITQGQMESYIKLIVSPSGVGAKLTGLIVERKGSGHDQDVEQVAVRRDGNFDGVFQSANDPEAGWSVFSSSEANISLDETLSADATYFVVLMAADDYLSWPGNTIGVSIAGVGSFASPNSQFEMEPVSITSALSPIVKLADTLSVSGTSAGLDLMPNVSRGTSNIPFMTLTLDAERDRVYLRAITVEKIGTLSENHVGFVKIYRDTNSNGQPDIGSGDDLISSGVDVFSSSQAVINLANPSTHTVAYETYFVTLGIDGAAPLGETLGVRISSAEAFALMAGTPDSVLLAVEPSDSDLPVIADPPNIMIVTPSSMGVSAIEQGETAALEKLELTADSGVAVWTELKVQRSTCSADTDYSRVALYEDNPPMGVFGGSDAMVSSGVFSAGQVTFSLSENISYTSTKTYFIVVDISPGAQTSNQAGVKVQSGYIKAASGQTTISAPFPFSSGLADITPTIDTVSVTPDSSIAPAVAYQGAANVPVVALDMKTDKNTADVFGIVFNQTGTAQDADIDSIRIFISTDSTFDPGLDTPVTGDYSFINGSATVSFSAMQNITTVEKFYFVAVDIAAGAVPGRTLQLAIADENSFSILAPDLVTSAFPITSNEITIEKLQATVLISTTNLAPASAQLGEQDIKMIKIALVTNQSTAEMIKLSPIHLGGSDSDISAVKFYWDSNTNGVLEPNELVSSGTFSGGSLTLPVSGQASDLSTVSRDYYVTMSLDPVASIGASIALLFPAGTGIELAGIDTVQGLPFQSESVLVSEPSSQLIGLFESMISTFVTQGDSVVLVASITLRASAYTVNWTGLNVLREGNGSDSDISEIVLYRDNGNGTWGGAIEEIWMTNAAFLSKEASLSFSAECLTDAGTTTYYIAANIASTATVGAAFGISVPAPATWLTVEGPDTVNISSFASSQAVIEPTYDTLIVKCESLAPSVRQGDVLKAIGKITLQSDDNAVRFTGIKLVKSAASTALDSDISGIRLYKDMGDDEFSPDDILIGGPGGLSNKSVNLLFPSPQTIETSPQIYFVVADFASQATVGASFGLDTSSGYFIVDAPDLVSVALSTFTTLSIAGTISDSSDTVKLAFADLASTSLYQGHSDNPMARLRLWTVEDKAVLTGIKVSLAGGSNPAGLSDLGNVKLRIDSDSDGVLDVTDVVIASGVFTSAVLTLQLSAPETLTTSPRDFFLTLDIPATAETGKTVIFSLADTSHISLEGEDKMESFSGLDTTQGTIRDLRIPTPPVIRIYKADGKLSLGAVSYNAYETRLLFHWEAVIYQGTLEQIYYSVGTSPAVSTSSWKPAGLRSDVTVTGLDLSHGSTYYVSLRAKNSLGEYWSDIVSRSFIVDSLKPVMPPGTLIKQEGDTVRIIWPAAVVGPSGLSYYLIEERKGTSPVWTAVSTTTGNTLIIIKSGTGVLSIERPAGTYYYRVRAVNGAGVSGDSTVPLTVNLGLDTLPSISLASVYPNPFDSRKRSVTINFTLNKASPVEIKIYDLFGSSVKKISTDGVAGANDIHWDGTDNSGRKVSKGVYLCVIRAVGDKKLLKIGVIH